MEYIAWIIEECVYNLLTAKHVFLVLLGYDDPLPCYTDYAASVSIIIVL